MYKNRCFVLIALSMWCTIECSQSWYNSTMCMANQTSGLVPVAAPQDNFAALDNTIGALALWWVPLGCNILRHKWNRRKVAEKIATEPTNSNLITHYVTASKQKESLIEGLVYDCLQERQFGGTCQTHSFLTRPVDIMDDYVGDSSSLQVRKRASYFLYGYLALLQRQKTGGIPEISKIVVDYFFDIDELEKERAGDENRATYQPLLSEPLISEPQVSLAMSGMPNVLLHATSELRGYFYLGKWIKNALYDGGVRMLWRGCKYGPGRLASGFCSPLLLGMDIGARHLLVNCFEKMRNKLGGDSYLYIGQVLCSTASTQACSLLLDYLILQRVD